MKVLKMLLLSGALVALALFASPVTAKTPVILDTDIGDDIDDTWALVMLLKSSELDPKLITTTCGKAEYRAKLIAKLLTIAGRTDIPIGLGEGGRKGTGGQQAWVKDFSLNDYPGTVHQDGAAAIIDLIARSPQTVTVISLGPSHTLAAVLERRPEVARKARFVGMQGSVFKGYGGGPVSAEYNVRPTYQRPKGCSRALEANHNHTPGHVRAGYSLRPAFSETAEQRRSPRQALLENYRVWAKQQQVGQLKASSVLFDTVAVYLAYPDRPHVKFVDALDLRDPRGLHEG